MTTDYNVYLDEILRIDGIDNEDAKDIIKMLNAKEDHRNIDSDFLKDFYDEKGCLHLFLKKVNDINSSAEVKNRLVVCFRGDRIIIYQNNHVLWEISQDGTGYKVEFNFNHARYTEDWESVLSGLCEETIGFKTHASKKEEYKIVDPTTGLKLQYRKDSKTKKETDLVTGGDIGTISCVKASFDEPFVDYTYDVFSGLITSFMKDSTDYFRKKVIELSKKPELHIKMADNIHDGASNPYIEKRWQQRLFHHYKGKKQGKEWIFVYDLEFSQSYPDKKIRGSMDANDPDMMAVLFDENGKANKLLMIEVKSTYKACWSMKKDKHQSDLWKHVEGMKRYCEMNFFVHSRIVDAYKLVSQYKLTGLYEELADADIESILSLSEEDIERVILLTGNALPDEEKNGKEKPSAIDFYKTASRRKNLKELLENNDPECKLWITESDYFADDIDIKEIDIANL